MSGNLSSAGVITSMWQAQSEPTVPEEGRATRGKRQEELEGQQKLLQRLYSSSTSSTSHTALGNWGNRNAKEADTENERTWYVIFFVVFSLLLVGF